MKQSSKQSSLTTVSYLLVGFLSLFIAFPIFILLHKQLPDYDWPIHSDRILLFALVIVFVLLLLSLFRPIINFIFLGSLILLLYGTFTDTYGFQNLATDYKAMFSAIKYDSEGENKMILDDSKFYYKTDILAATNYRDPEVRSFAIRAANASFKKEQNLHERYRDIIQCFAVFKKINRNWNYVNDPVGQEYFAKASESVKYLAGDCDDHAIMMVAAIRSIGGTARFVATTGHLYPEMLIGDKFDIDKIDDLIKNVLFPIESKGQSLHYHTDPDGKIWLNLDYSAAYPGGRYYADAILGILLPK
ncbi:MAG TPA: transglutaminase family protein [Chitinophagaceae bacterium]|nr:transglutaminase family protein [Chitinophagaceae bacterium]